MRWQSFAFASCIVACSGGGDSSSSTSSSSSGGASSSSGGTSSSGSSSGSGSTSDHCTFSGTMSGGIEGTFTPNGCGTGGSNSFSVAEADFAKKTSIGLRIFLVAELKGGELGSQPVERIEIFKKEGDTDLVWRSTACTIELTKSEHSPTDVFENRYLLEGKGTCPSPLDAVAPNTNAAITLPTFEFGAFINPR